MSTKYFLERQLNLHNKAMKLLQDIKECQSFFDFDREYMQQKIEEYRREYAEVVKDLVQPVMEKTIEVPEGSYSNVA